MYAINRFSYFETFNFVNFSGDHERTSPFQTIGDVSQIVKTEKFFILFHQILVCLCMNFVHNRKKTFVR